MNDREKSIVIDGLSVLCGFDTLLENRGYEIEEIDALREKIQQQEVTLTNKK